MGGEPKIGVVLPPKIIHLFIFHPHRNGAHFVGLERFKLLEVDVSREDVFFVEMDFDMNGIIGWDLCVYSLQVLL